MSKRALIVLVHGSRNSRAVKEMLQLPQRLKQHMLVSFDYIETAFLELAEPTMDEVVKNLCNLAVEECVVMPYFLSAGNHVERDIPQLIAELKVQYPACRFDLLDYFGSNQHIVDWISGHINNSVC